MLLRHSLVYLTSRAVAVAAMLFAAFAYTRILSPKEYGAYALVNTGVTLAFTVAMLWICSSGLRLLPAAEKPRALRAGLLASYLLALAVLGLAGAAALILLPTPEWRALAVIGFVMLVVLGWLELNLHLLIAESKSVEYGSLNAVRAVAAVAIGTAFAFAGWGTPGALVGATLGMLLPGIWLAAKYWRGIGPPRLDTGTLREIAVYGLPLLVGSALSGLTRSADRLLIAVLAGTEAVGLYAIGFNIADNVLLALMAPIGGAGFSLAVRALEQEGKEAASRQLSENVVLLIGIGLPGAAGLSLVSRNLVDTLVGEQFHDVAGTVIPILAFSCLMNGVRSHYLDHAFQLGRRTGYHSAQMLIIALTSLALNLALIPPYGAVGAAVAMLATHSLGLIIAYGLGRRIFRLPLPVAEIGKIATATGIMAIPVFALRTYTGAIWLLPQILTGVAVYFAAAYVLNVGNLRSKIVLRWRRA